MSNQMIEQMTLPLSNDLQTIELEINQYQQSAGHAVFQIGRRLNWVKEHDLTHGEFSSWLQTMKFDHDMANRFMRVARELNESEAYQQLGYSALYQIASLPESERDKPHQIDGATKTPDEMTVAELKTLRQKLKRSEEHAEQLQDQIDHQEPVYPEDYGELQEIATSARQREKNLQEVIENMREEMTALEADSNEYQDLQKQINKLTATANKEEAKLIAMKDFAQLDSGIEQLLDQLAPLLYSTDFSQFESDDPAVSHIKRLVGRVHDWTAEMESLMPKLEDEYIKGDVINVN
ncbi:hypothetical protein FH621_07725 [Latilactobacillus curvatus]|uniref:DUF3102 domain-containing protein n=1 Tax=Latilactobacillus curvatus TaxID=28038 RepID=UPI00217E89D8|nr:DUF3102 domain-containing protein [Latilactobacillus curvatus]MCS6143415.1 hypothetical protein [Latilactobacillus curvatus]